MTIWAASQNLANRYVIGDILVPLCRLWKEIIENPTTVTARYNEIWKGQKPNDPDYYFHIRSRYNTTHDPVDLLYLTCRCVKNAVRFNDKGEFNQSPDKRRLGMRPDNMENAVMSVSSLLKGRVEIRPGDWNKTVSDATSRDYVYLDPPYLGTSMGRDKRYAHQIEQEALISGLESLIGREIPFSLSYDGMTGGKTYGPALPDELGMSRLFLHAGISSQGTLHGRKEETIESLYVWPELLQHDDKIIRHDDGTQASLAF